MWASIIKWVGHWAIYFVLSALVVFACWATFIKPTFKPNPTNIQNGGTSYTVHVGFGGCARIPVVETPTQKVIKAVTPVVNVVKSAVKK
jgi:hypothetical protein